MVILKINMKKYYIITYGCQMNKADSERIATILEKKGYSPAKNTEEADLILVNMCSVRQSAVDRAYGLIPKFKKLKAKNPELKTILTGCILKKDGIKIAKGFDQIIDFNDLLKYMPKRQKRALAYIPISNGCNNACTYCVVPYTRGKLFCRDHKEIIMEVKNAVKMGFTEIWLLGQNVNNYQSPADSKINFARLLKLVDKISGDFQIRFMSPHPTHFTDELINTMAKCKKIAHFLNLPVQSGDNKILKAMNRTYTVEQYKNLVEKIRRKIPDINLSTDVIVGFPGETKKQFENTAKLFKELKFNIAYIAKYSPRPGNAAFKLKDNVPYKEKQRRWKILNNIISMDLRNQYI